MRFDLGCTFVPRVQKSHGSTTNEERRIIAFDGVLLVYSPSVLTLLLLARRGEW